MKYVTLAVVVVLAAAAALMPGSKTPPPAETPPLEPPAVAVCSVVETSTRTSRVSVLSTVDWKGTLTVFAGGDGVGSVGYRTGPAGAVAIDVVEVAAVGTAGALVETPVVSSAVGTVIFGTQSLAAEPCASSPEQTTMVAGGSTTEGHSFEVQLMNPFASEAVVRLVVQSDAGLESNERFSSMVVPPLDSVTVDFTELIPGREDIAVTVEALEGRVVAVGQQVNDARVVQVRAVAPAQDWFLPIPAAADDRWVVIANTSDTEIEYQMDLYGPEGVEEGYELGTLPAHAQVEVSLTPAGEQTLGVRVLATGPVVPSLWMETETGLAATTGSADPATRWMLPGAGAPEEGRAVLVVMNPALEDVSVTVRPLRRNSEVSQYDLGAESLLELELEPAVGYLVESTGPTVVVWMAERQGAAALAAAVPIQR